MKQHRKWRIACSIVFVVIGVCVAFFALSMKTLLFLPKGELLFEAASPNEDRMIRVYRCSGGATVDTDVRCEVSGKGVARRNIYWQYHVSTASVKWLDNDNVSINGMDLQIQTDCYDYRQKQAP